MIEKHYGTLLEGAGRAREPARGTRNRARGRGDDVSGGPELEAALAEALRPLVAELVDAELVSRYRQTIAS
jgi:hypothetical protein